MSVAALYDERLRSAHSIDDVATAIGAASFELGFSYHALVQHCDYRQPPDRLLFVHNYPVRWVDLYARRGFHRHDPAQRMANQRPVSFVWNDLPELTSLTKAERTVLDASRDAGLGEGFTVPLHAYGVRAASCSFATQIGTSLPCDALADAEALARMAFSRVFDLFYPNPATSAVCLPARERECVALMACGKTDWETATILGLAEETVTGYLKSARRRFGVTRRTQLAVAALAHGLLGWDEILTWQRPD
jgi:LuxR family quorum-sensing system transcriptional regulator CciR